MFTKRMSFIGAGIMLAVFCGSAAADGVALGINLPYFPQGNNPFAAGPVFVPFPVSVPAVPRPAYVRPAPGFIQAPVSPTTTVTGPVYQMPRSMLAPLAPASAMQPAVAPAATITPGR